MEKNISPNQKMNSLYYKGFISALTKKNRDNREAKIVRLLNINSSTNILDVGCGPLNRSISNIMGICKEVVGVDLFDPKYVETKNEKFKYIQLDASDLSSFEDNKFDVGLNFGMMEHMPEPKRTEIFNEMFRVCRKVAIIVPHKYAFVEPHFKLPFFGIFPLFLQVFLVKYFKLHGYGAGSYEETKKNLQSDYFWLSTKKWKSYHSKSTSHNIWYGPLLLNLLVVFDTEK